MVYGGNLFMKTLGGYSNYSLPETNEPKLINTSDIQINVNQQEDTRLDVALIVDISKEAREKYNRELDEGRDGLTVKNQQIPIIIPNIQTNDLLVQSLKGTSQEVVDAVYDTIEKDLLNKNLGNLSEEERQQIIALGLEKSKYIAANYLQGEQAGNFLKAMETIAKYALNGTKNEDGTISYHIENGPLVGAPDDYINKFDLMKMKDPETYEKYAKNLREALETNDMIKYMDAMRELTNWVERATRSNPKLVEEALKNYTKWKNKINETLLPTYFTNTNFSSKEAFTNSILSNDSNKLLQDSLDRFMSFLH